MIICTFFYFVKEIRKLNIKLLTFVLIFILLKYANCVCAPALLGYWFNVSKIWKM